MSEREREKEIYIGKSMVVQGNLDNQGPTLAYDITKSNKGGGEFD